jgi:hypothetical protein
MGSMVTLLRTKGVLGAAAFEVRPLGGFTNSDNNFFLYKTRN